MRSGAFIDCKTLPRNTWLESYLKDLLDNNLEIVLATRYTFSTNRFSEYLKFLTYGNNKILSLAGTIGKSEIIMKNLFNSKIRAGEDLIWINYIKNNQKFIQSKNNLIVYNNLPDTFSKTIRKWFLYSQHNSTIEGFSEFNRLYYLILFLFVILFNVFYYYYYLEFYTEYIKINIFFMHLILFLFYFLFRGLYRPVFIAKISFLNLLPYKWIQIGFIGVTLDIVKIPGLITGLLRTLIKRLSLKN